MAVGYVSVDYVPVHWPSLGVLRHTLECLRWIVTQWPVYVSIR